MKLNIYSNAIKSTRTFLVCSVIVSTVASCESNSCGDLSQYEGTIDVTGIKKIEAVRRISDYSLAPVDENTPISLRNLSLHVTMDYVTQRNNVQTSRSIFLNLFIESAYACSPQDKTVNSKVIDVDLFSNASLGEPLEAGTSLKEAYLIERWQVSGIFYGENYPEIAIPMQQYVSDNPISAAVEYVLTPKSSTLDQLTPTNGEAHQFTFSITLESGEMFTAMTNPVLISN